MDPTENCPACEFAPIRTDLEPNDNKKHSGSGFAPARVRSLTISCPHASIGADQAAVLTIQTVGATQLCEILSTVSNSLRFLRERLLKILALLRDLGCVL